MKFAMLQTPSGPMPAVATSSGYVSVADIAGQAPPSLEALIRDQDRWLPALREVADGAVAPDTSPPFRAPMTERSVIAIGLNYADHAKELAHDLLETMLAGFGTKIRTTFVASDCAFHTTGASTEKVAHNHA